jgi:predicted transcriptional regulator
MCQDDQNKIWETAEDNRLALDVLQLRLRREMLRFISRKVGTVDEIARCFCLTTMQAQYHLELLERALVIEHAKDGYRATKTGLLHLGRAETNR